MSCNQCENVSNNYEISMSDVSNNYEISMSNVSNNYEISMSNVSNNYEISIKWWFRDMKFILVFLNFLLKTRYLK